MASDTKKTKVDPAPKTEAAPIDKSPAAEPAAKAADSNSGVAAPSHYSRGEGQKPVTPAYKENWNAIFAKKKAKKKKTTGEEKTTARMVVIYQTPTNVAAFDKWGRVDVLVNSAGRTKPAPAGAVATGQGLRMTEARPAPASVPPQLTQRPWYSQHARDCR